MNAAVLVFPRLMDQRSATYIHFFFLVWSTEETDINPKVLQLIQGEKVKVRKENWSSAAVSTSQALQPNLMPQREVLIPSSLFTVCNSRGQIRQEWLQSTGAPAGSDPVLGVRGGNGQDQAENRLCHFER